MPDNIRAAPFMPASMAGVAVDGTFVRHASADLSAPEIVAGRRATAGPRSTGADSVGIPTSEVPV